MLIISASGNIQSLDLLLSFLLPAVLCLCVHTQRERTWCTSKYSWIHDQSFWITVLCLVTESCPTLCNPMDCICQACPWGFSSKEYLSGLPCPPGDLPNPRIELRPPSIQADSLPSEPPGNPFVVQLLSRVQLFVTSWTAACQASLSFTIS